MDTKSRTKSIVLPCVKLGIALLVIASITKALSHYHDQLDLAEVNYGLLGFALALTLVYRLANACGWNWVLESFQVKMPMRTSLRIWLSSEACRWLPGSVWSYGSRALQARKYGVPTATAGASLALEMLLTIGAWCLTAMLGWTLYADAYLDLFRRIPLDRIPRAFLPVTAAMIASLLLGLFIGRRWIRNRVASRCESTRNRLSALRTARPRWRICLFALAYYIAMCGINGVAAWTVFRAVASQSNVPLLAVIGANAAAWLIGFFAIMAPGGLVVREAAMASLLLAWMPADQAIAAAIVWRFLQIVVEALCIAGVYTLPWVLRFFGSHATA